MAWTVDQEELIGIIMAAEILNRLEQNQSRAVAMIFDPALPQAAKNLLKNRLNTLKTTHQTEQATLPQRQSEAELYLTRRISLIDSILAQLP